MNNNIKIDISALLVTLNKLKLYKEEEEKLEYGRKVHELFELTDFHNIDNLKDKDKDIIIKFLDKVKIGSANTYKEYEFIYEKDNITYL